MNLVIAALLFLGQLAVETEPDYSAVESVLKIGIGAFSLLLLALSISAYRTTGMRRLVYAAAAFALFAVQLFLEYVEDVVESLGPLYDAVLFPGITLAILVLFFLAIVRGK
jgi:hypothetical protein